MLKIFNTSSLKKLLLITALCACLCSGCAKETSIPPSETPGQTVAAPSATPIATTEPDVTPSPEPVETTQDDEDAMATIHNGWIYYLDVNDPIVVEYSEDPPLRMKKEDGSEEKDLDIRGFFFDIIGDYIYIDSNDLDMDETGMQTWGTTRVSLDGSAKKRLEFGSMSARLIPEGEQKFYFTTLGDCAIYVSDFACEDVTVLMINLPNQSEMDKQLGTGNMLSLSISSIANGLINFEVSVSADDGTILYSGTYKTNLSGSSTEKVSGTYYEYDPSENE